MLETPQGGIWESNAIARYLARLSDSGLFGSTPIETVRARFSLGLRCTVTGCLVEGIRAAPHAFQMHLSCAKLALLC